ncbi:hypothetical protein RT43_GL001753 [Enterococcus italicus DSM 15952]|nr:hypothetical protein RT43_GL001753 [Enterococcus italicus DSM 15952]
MLLHNNTKAQPTGIGWAFFAPGANLACGLASNLLSIVVFVLLF